MTYTWLQVALGGAIGASARYGINIVIGRLIPGLPIGTLLVNIAGSFMMGLLTAVFAHRGGQQFAPLLLTGVLGGFTTFSAFSLDTLTLWERGQAGLAAGYVIFSVALSLIAILCGISIGRAVLA
ncbi:fluoride efflux transporter CrcB [Paracoccus sp. (in: a-proteobacteria)]|uniref:fluoride efflux transporter CrcB n=1 Tax=Paracoccus sp. TaxID=267 RepID=UPI00289BAA4C|nr:fluoride efflux transporter CrcB [Paracoccus sp. (in: a-proteobacteria)]